MPMTTKQRDKRLHSPKYGSSDSPKIVGVSPFGGQQDVYHDKIYQLERSPTASMQTGNRLEAPLLQFASEELGLAIRPNQYRVSHGDDGGLLASHLDGLVVDKREGVEAKYVSQARAAEWGTPGTDEVPDDVIIQCQHHCYVAELELVWVPVAVAGFTMIWQMYRVPRHEELIRLVVQAVINFDLQHVQPRIPPTSAPPPLTLIQALRREPNSLVALEESAGDVLAAYEEATKIKRLAELSHDDAKRQLLALLGEAEAGRLDDGTVVTYLEQNSPARCDLKRFRLEQAELYEQYITQGTHRVLRIKRAKELQDDRQAPTKAKLTGPDKRGPARTGTQ
jgi:predicted phage-related endonuclease